MTITEAKIGPWRRAAQIAAEARELGLREARPGADLKELADRIESFIRTQGAEPAFPANLSRNTEAAHFTPSPDSKIRLEAGDLLKVDVGAHIDGAIADTAMTIEVGGGRRHENLIRAVREALEAGIAQVGAGVSVDEIGRAIQAAVQARGLKPVQNLTGHTIEPYLLHAGVAVPNVRGLADTRLAEGQVLAIEPFVTNGAGLIENGPFGNIVRFRADPAGSDATIQEAYRRFRTLPFTTRWLPGSDGAAFLKRARRSLQTYPVFVEQGQGFVAQAEHTIWIGPDGPEVLTRSA
jgi:methionyl aminopeptidase